MRGHYKTDLGRLAYIGRQNVLCLMAESLYAMKKDIDICVSSIRVSYDKPLTDEEVNYFIFSVEEIFNSLRK